MLAILSLGHRNDVATPVSQVLTEKDLTVRDAHKIKEAAKLTTKERIIVDLQHAEDVFLQFNLQSHEVVDWI